MFPFVGQSLPMSYCFCGSALYNDNKPAARAQLTNINRSAGSVLEFQQNEIQNQQEFVKLLNNKAAAIFKTMELPGDK